MPAIVLHTMKASLLSSSFGNHSFASMQFKFAEELQIGDTSWIYICVCYMTKEEPCIETHKRGFHGCMACDQDLYNDNYKDSNDVDDDDGNEATHENDNQNSFLSRQGGGKSFIKHSKCNSVLHSFSGQRE